MIKVAVIPEFFVWGGGFDFLRHIINGLLAAAQKHPIEITVAVKRALQGSQEYKQFQDYIEHTGLVNNAQCYYESHTNDLAQVLAEHNVDIVLPVNSDLGRDFPIPWVGYIPDFQHKYLYENFTEHECFARETAFAARLRDTKTLLVNSEAVRQDILKFYPWINKQRVFSLPYSPHPMPEWLASNDSVRQQYDVGERYYMVCNQFWVHKDHPTAFKAFAILDDKDVELVCTGSVSDYRRPNYANEINTLLNELNIQHRVKLLGHISKHDQISLMKESLAVIQPTLFEGGPGGGAVYDAVSLGVPVILSNIRVNQEVSAEQLDFFEAGNPESLHAAMTQRLHRSDRPSRNELLEKGHKNQLLLGEKLYQIITQTLNAYQSH